MEDAALTSQALQWIAPRDDEIHLWFAFQDDVRDESLFARYRALLTEDEREREQRFHFEKHRPQYLVTRALIRTVLAGYTGIDAEVWRFASDAYGRPDVIAPTQACGVSFNLAHTEGLVVCACASAGRIGVDVEGMTGPDSGPEIADRYFSAAEMLELRALPREQQLTRFVHYWTLKESYIKAIGKGLSQPLDQFSFSLAQPGDISLAFHTGLLDDPRRWSFWLMRPGSMWVTALCAERTAGDARKLISRRVVPLASAEVFDCELIARSA